MLMLILWELTLQEVLSDVPNDAGALVVYTLFAVFIGFVWIGGRTRSEPRASGPERGRGSAGDEPARRAGGR